ncbi:hypothetical protein [Pseudoalteromonas phage PH357]|nr:hypothetical protein [Pseudoalteromonas phage PH357]
MNGFKRFETAVHKFTKNLYSRPKPVIDTFEEITLCGCCNGRGYFVDKYQGKSECNNCNSTGRIKLRVTVERVEDL